MADGASICCVFAWQAWKTSAKHMPALKQLQRYDVCLLRLPRNFNVTICIACARLEKSILCFDGASIFVVFSWQAWADFAEHVPALRQFQRYDLLLLRLPRRKRKS
jgi:hypothetical protein